MGLLTGFKIVEFAAIGPVPWCSRLLAGMGANIVRIDRPGGAPAEEDRDFLKGGRTAVALDLKTTEGVQAALSLVANADVVLEGLRPGAMERLGLGPRECLEVNPALVYGRMTGWGQQGPLASRAGHDINYIALTGALHAIGTAQRPAVPLNLIGDFGGGGAFLAVGVLAALLRARASGKGEVIDAAMVDGASFLMAMPYARLHTGQWKDERGQNVLDGGAPWYDVYQTSDGKFMAVGAIEPQFYSELLAGLGIPEDSLPARDKREHWPQIRRRFEEVFRTRTRDEWAALLEPSDACATPVLSMTEAPQHPHNRARSTFVEWEGHPVPAAAPRTLAAPSPHSGRSQTATVAGVLRDWSRNGPLAPQI